MSFGKCCLILLLAFLVATGGLWLSRSLWLQALGSWLITDSEPEKVDAIVAASGDQDRRKIACDLYQQGFSDYLIFNVSDTSYYFGRPIDPVTSVKEYADLRGVPDSALILNKDIGSTFEDAFASLNTCRRMQFKSIMVVTSAFNSRRLNLTYRKIFAKSGIETLVFALPAEEEGMSADKWWQREKELIAVNNEYIKLLYYIYRLYLSDMPQLDK